MNRRLLGLLGGITALFAVFLLLLRPWYLRWGATDEEVRKPLPGDEIIPNAGSQETRAITIAAPAGQVWSWVAQLGQDRGGFYSYDILENLVGCRMPTEDRLRPEAQRWQPGDKLWMYPPTRAGGIGFATLRSYLPGRALGFATRAPGTSLAEPEDGSWSFVVEPVSATETRLLIRGRLAEGRSLLGQVVDRAMFEPMHFVMERRTMLGIKALAEGVSRDRWLNHLQVGLWVLVAGAMIGGIVLLLRSSRWPRALLLVIAAASVFQLLTFTQPRILIGAVLVALLSVLCAWSLKPSHGVVPRTV